MDNKSRKKLSQRIFGIDKAKLKAKAKQSVAAGKHQVNEEVESFDPGWTRNKSDKSGAIHR